MPQDDLTDRPIEIPVADPAPAPKRPEFFRLPTRGMDPYFGLRRSYYYALEAEGKIRFRRIRRRGCARGVTLVPFQAVADFLNSDVCN